MTPMCLEVISSEVDYSRHIGREGVGGWFITRKRQESDKKAKTPSVS